MADKIYNNDDLDKVQYPAAVPNSNAAKGAVDAADVVGYTGQAVASAFPDVGGMMLNTGSKLARGVAKAGNKAIGAVTGYQFPDSSLPATDNYYTGYTRDALNNAKTSAGRLARRVGMVPVGYDAGTPIPSNNGMTAYAGEGNAMPSLDTIPSHIPRKSVPITRPEGTAKQPGTQPPQVAETTKPGMPEVPGVTGPPKSSAMPDIITNDFLENRYGAMPDISQEENAKILQDRLAANKEAQNSYDQYTNLWGGIHGVDEARRMQKYVDSQQLQKRQLDLANAKIFQDKYGIDMTSALKKMEMQLNAPKIAAETEKLTQEATAVPKLAEADTSYKKSLADNKSLSAKSYRGQWFVDQGKILTNKLYDPLTPEEEKPAIRTALTQIEGDLAELENKRSDTKPEGFDEEVTNPQGIKGYRNKETGKIWFPGA
jgi:hypothetical protein